MSDTKFQIASGHYVAEWEGGPNVIVRIVDESRDVPIDPDDARMLAVQLNVYADAASAFARGVSVPESFLADAKIRQALVRALVVVEWGDYDDGGSPVTPLGDRPFCPYCSASVSWLDYDGVWHRGEHAPGCELDAALTAAGLKTQEQRDEARTAEAARSR